VNYVQHRVSTKSEDRSTAQRFLRKKLQQLGGRRPRAIDPGDITYEDLRAALLAEYVEKGSRSLRRGKLSNLGRVDRYFAGWRVGDFTVKALKEFRQSCRKDGITDATTNRCMAAIRRMFNLALENEVLELADVPGYFPMENEPNVARGAIFIKDEWYDPLCRTLSEPLRSAFILCYHIGPRVGEVEKLRWRDIELNTHEVALPSEITKTSRSRPVPLPSDFKLKPGNPNDLVFPNLNTREPWKAACVQLGIGKYRCRICEALCDGQICPTDGKQLVHDLSYSRPYFKHTRHTAVRNMRGTGQTESRIMAIAGHKTRAIFDRYSIGKEGDVEDMRQSIERAHRERQAKLKKGK
jgi:integrase